MAKYCKWMFKYVMYSWRPPTSTLRPPYIIHMMNAPIKALPFFTTLLLPCIIVYTNTVKNQKTGGAWGQSQSLTLTHNPAASIHLQCGNSLVSQASLNQLQHGLSSSPGPTQKKGLVTHVKVPYELHQQSSFGVHKSHSSIANY